MNDYSSPTFREPNSAQAGGYTLAVAGILVAGGLMFHPLPVGGFEEQPSLLSTTPWWGIIHVAIAMGFVLCVLGGLLILMAGGVIMKRSMSAFCWGALTVGMIYFTGVSLLNGWVMHPLAHNAAQEPVLYEALNHLLVGFGWLGNPLFLIGLTGITFLEFRHSVLGLPRWWASIGLLMALLSWGRGIGSATGLYFLEPLIIANIPAFLWLAYYGIRITQLARQQSTSS